ncbi:IS66 family element, transposase [Acetobacteraceae bacterium AT-5844]|nr:IS66 family element, transposase [Acetobacteraceae bacterium AT-5844]
MAQSETWRPTAIGQSFAPCFCGRSSVIDRSDDRASEADDREAQARALWSALRAHDALHRPDGTQLEELEAKATEDELAAEAMSRQASLPARLPGRPVRKPFPQHLPRERVVIAAPTSCPCCGSLRLSKLGDDVTETLEVIPHQWKVIQTAREKFTCRECEAITQPPAPFHARRAALWGRTCWRCCCLRSSVSINRSTAKASAMAARASTSRSRRWPTRLARRPWRLRRCMS